MKTCFVEKEAWDYAHEHLDLGNSCDAMLTVYPHRDSLPELVKVVEHSAYDDLRMVCRRLAAAKSLETRDKIAKQCHHLFYGNPLRADSKGESGK